MLSFPSQNEQYLLELSNRFRVDPGAELDRLLNLNNNEVAIALDFFGTDRNVLRRQWQSLEAAPPLAWASALHDSAARHNERSIAADDQQHFFPGEPGLLDRMRETGYDPASVGENLFAYPDSIEAAHAGLVIDWGVGPHGIQEPAGHRITLLNPVYREVGIDIVEERDPNTSVGTYVVTQHFGVDRATIWGLADAFLVGAVYSDAIVRDDFYTPGEGLGGVAVTASEIGGDRVFSTETWNAGGYQMQLPAGRYRVEFATDFDGDRQVDRIARTIEIGGDNVKLDLATDRIALTELTGSPPTIAPDTTSNATDPATEPASTQPPRQLGTMYDDILLLDSPDLDAIPREAQAGDLETDREIGAEMFFGLPIGDTLTCTDDRDYAHGDDGDDLIFGNRGDDTLTGDLGNDTIVGGRGDDRIVAGLDRDLVFGNIGRDLIYGGCGDDTLDGGRDRDGLDGGDGADLLYGGTDDDTLIGGLGSDTLFGNAGRDGIDGSDGADYLYGGADDDTLIGSGGDDWLDGQRGDDTLIGGSGNDRFVLATTSGADTVVDFTPGQDAIGLAGVELGHITIAPHADGLTISANTASLTLLGIERSQIGRRDFFSIV